MGTKVLVLAVLIAFGVMGYRIYTLMGYPLHNPTAEQLIEQTVEPDIFSYTGGAYAQSIMESARPRSTNS
jgi:hypothetical protein